MVNWDCGAIVWSPVPGMLKLTISWSVGLLLVLASSMACLKEPAPMSFVLVTVKVAGAAVVEEVRV